MILARLRSYISRIFLPAPSSPTNVEPGLRWRCDVCCRVRPDAQISTAVTEREIYNPPEGCPPLKLLESVKFCNDSPACAERAKTIRYAPATLARDV